MIDVYFQISLALWFSSVLHGPPSPWLCMQVSKYRIPSEKELKHINRKLKSCWGHSSHDEYFLTLLWSIGCYPFTPPPQPKKNVERERFSCYYFLIISDCFTGARSGRRNQSTSPEGAQMIKHKMCVWSSFIFLSIEQLIWILDGSFFLFYFYLKVELLSQWLVTFSSA